MRLQRWQMIRTIPILLMGRKKEKMWDKVAKLLDTSCARSRDQKSHCEEKWIHVRDEGETPRRTCGLWFWMAILNPREDAKKVSNKRWEEMIVTFFRSSRLILRLSPHSELSNRMSWVSCNCQSCDLIWVTSFSEYYQCPGLVCFFDLTLSLSPSPSLALLSSQ